MGCPDLSTTITVEEAHAVLEPYFLAAREVFEQAEDILGVPAKRIRGVRFEIWPEAHDTPRHFAGCSETGKLIVAAPEMVELTEQVVSAIFLHEMGHAADFLVPGRFRLKDGDVELLEAYKGAKLDPDVVRDRKILEVIANRYSQWQRRSSDTVERTADAIAALASGHTIGYMGPCRLQHLDAGGPRPKGLR